MPLYIKMADLLPDTAFVRIRPKNLPHADRFSCLLVLFYN